MAIILSQINGLADSKWNGIPGSVAACVGLDLHSTPGLTKVHQKLTKESGSTVTELVKVVVAASNGYSFWFSSESGKIWARTSAGSWSLALTTTAAAGEVKCLGAMEFNGYIYWATQSRLHRIAIANADDAWASESLNWATFSVTNASYHPMAIQDLTLFIGDGNIVCSVDSAGTFNSSGTGNSLDIKTPYVIKTMIDYELDLLIGTTVSTATTVNRADIIRWDCVSDSWNTLDPIEEVSINAFIRDDNYVYINAGRAGNLYFYNGEKLEPYKRIPGDYSSTSYGYIHPNATGNFKGIPIFGFSNGSGNPAPQGVYSFGSYSKDYEKIMDLSWVISPDVTSSIEIGALLVADFDLLVAWKSGSSYGVDKIDYTAKYASAYFETRMLFQDVRDVLKTLQEISAFYNSLPASTGITFSYSVNGAAYVSMTSITDSVLARVKSTLTVSSVGSLQIKVAFTVSSNNAPTMEALGVEMN